ncbi:hypothetical protein AVHY2522_22935 [Acidovorax sp. SUPP2522]|uniref:hypothetical protein n=2 Tax=unclassified Acidovorax TaxID=2684926 RepID=UPI0023DE3D19|nr:hypothetical protein [Acidovorax sp. SUPP2522]GKT19561.1 hypothetical protein AVHY2522_22935 [Acidovorax sp. SUPP2522]
MPVTAGTGGGVPNMTLKAWAYVTSAGALVRGFNVASASRAGLGAYQVNFSAAMATAEYVGRVVVVSSASSGVIATVVTNGTGSCKVFPSSGGGGGGGADSAFYVEIYE